MAGATKYKSIFKTTKQIKNLPDGSYKVQFLNFTTAHKIATELVEFVDGHCEVVLDTPPGMTVVAKILTGSYPASSVAVFDGKTIGFCYSNDTYIDFLTIQEEVSQVNGETYLEGDIIIINDTAKLCIYRNGRISFNPDCAYDYLNPGESVTETFTYRTTSGNVGQFEILILASENVGENLLRDYSSYASTGWTAAGSVLAHQVGNEQPIQTADLLLENGCVYELSFEVQGLTAGSIQPMLSGATDERPMHDLALNAREVFYMRASANLCRLSIVPTSDFDGAIDMTNVYFRKLLATDGVAEFRRAHLTATGFNSLDFEFRLSAFKRRSDDLQFDYAVKELYLGRSKLYQPTFWYDNSCVENVLLEDLDFSQSGQGIWGVVDREVARSVRADTAESEMEIFNLQFEGGYVGASADEQAAFKFGNNGQTCGKIHMYHIDIDEKRSPNLNDYNTDNSDCIRMNGGWTIDANSDYLVLVDCFATGAGDGCLDIKSVNELNLCEFVGSNYQYRMHQSHSSVVNSNFERLHDSNGFANLEHPVSIMGVHNCSLEGERMVTFEQVQAMVDDKGGFGHGRPPIFAWDKHVKPPYVKHLLRVMKTMPRLRDYAKIAATDLQIQIAPTGTQNYSDVYANGMISGHHLKNVEVPAGNYDIRARIRNGAESSDWNDLGANVRVLDLVNLTLPSEFDFFTSSYTVRSDGQTNFDVTDFRPATTVTVYVSNAGDDSNDGLTEASPKLTLQSALNVTDVDEILMQGNFDNADIGVMSGNSGDLVLGSYGTGVTLYAGEAKTWSAHSTFANVYECTNVGTSHVIDESYIDAINDKVYTLINRNDLAALDTAESGYYHNGATDTTYVKLHDLRAPDTSVRVANTGFIAGSNYNVTYYENLTLIGMAMQCQDFPNSTQTLVSDGCEVQASKEPISILRGGSSAVLSDTSVFNCLNEGIEIRDNTTCIEYNVQVNANRRQGSISSHNSKVVRIGGQYIDNRYSQIEITDSAHVLNVNLTGTRTDPDVPGGNTFIEVENGISQVYILSCKNIDGRYGLGGGLLGDDVNIFTQNNTFSGGTPANLF